MGSWAWAVFCHLGSIEFQILLPAILSLVESCRTLAEKCVMNVTICVERLYDTSEYAIIIVIYQMVTVFASCDAIFALEFVMDYRKAKIQWI